MQSELYTQCYKNNTVNHVVHKKRIIKKEHYLAVQLYIKNQAGYVAKKMKDRIG